MTRATVVLLLLNGCVLFNAERNAETVESLVTVHGQVNARFPTFVVLFRKENGALARMASRILYAPGTFEILAQPGALTLFAFSDETGAWKPGDPSQSVALGDVSARDMRDLGALVLAAPGPPPPEPIDFNATDAPHDRVVLHSGDLATLDEERFTPAAGKLGLWQPADFALKYGLGVSFLEPYDPKKTPVLFVHGASGTPAHFRSLVAGLDHTRFQAWVYSYPSGGRLGRITQTLSTIVDDLHTQIGFKRLLVVGYSMGGLVAHAFAARTPYVKLLITLSAPYGGDDAARVGVKISPVVVPFWVDMADGSPFLKALRVPMAAPHILFFSYRGRGDDGTVPLRTMLVPEVQQAALQVEGFDETHDTMVTSPTVGARVNSALLDAVKP